MPLMVAGTTGLVGASALRGLLLDEKGPLVFAPGRRAPAMAHPRLCPIVADLADPASDGIVAERLRAECPGGLRAFVSCLGTTIRVAGSQAAFRAVDHDLVLRLARIARGHGASHAIVVSSVGADARSGNFYLRVKGETERDVAALGFARCDFVRPGLLLGDRRERRLAERVFQRVTPLFNPLLAGPLERYKAIPASTVAHAVVGLTKETAPGAFVHEYGALVHSER